MSLSGLSHGLPRSHAIRPLAPALRRLATASSAGVPFCITSLVVFLSLAALRRVEKAASESVKKRLAIQRMGL